MVTFDTKTAYVDQEEVFFDDGREIELLHFVYGRPNLEEIRGSPRRVLEAIDEYGRTKKYLMNVGQDKGEVVTNLIRERKPEVMVSRRTKWLFHIGEAIANMRDRSSLEATWATRVSSSPMLCASLAVVGIIL
jgi:hypothetical protein